VGSTAMAPTIPTVSPSTASPMTAAVP
jgi:hypothetical protein